MSDESNSLDEALSGTGRSVRMALMMGGQAAEVVARRLAEQQRQLAEESRDRNRVLEASFYDARDTARQAYEPVTDRETFQRTPMDTAATAWAAARAWAEADPRAAQAEAALREQIHERWGVNPEEFFREETAEPTVEATPLAEQEAQADPEMTNDAQAERFAEVMDPQWRESASDAALEARWHEANDAGDRPGAAEVRATLDSALAERHGIDLEKFHEQLNNGLGEDLWHAEADRGALDADEAAEGDAERKAAGWENEAAGQHGREANADDVGEEVEESVDAREAQGMANQWGNEADAEHAENQAESRADPEAMQANGVPPRSREVRTSTARGFGTSTEQGAQAKRHRKARKNVNKASRSTERDLGR